MENSVSNKKIRIACLGWGSLVWDSRELNIPKDKWSEDGPTLPIEFSRYSSDGRVTLIIDIQAQPVVVLWVELNSHELSSAIESLAAREGTSLANIHYAQIEEVQTDSIKMQVATWMKSKGLDAAIWTGLSYKGNIRPTIDQVLTHLKTLDTPSKKRAEEYVKRAPEQIITKYRRRIEDELGWLPDCSK